MRALQEQLLQGSAGLGLALGAAESERLLDYLDLLQKWNAAYNLTALRDPARMLTHHLLDSLAVVPALRRQLAMRAGGADADLLDVGSGAGLPGIVLALCFPELAVTCVDSVGKKAAFIQQAALSLRLPNLRGVHARVEDLKGSYGVAVSRAFSSLLQFTQLSESALAPAGIWLAMKGRQPVEELAALPPRIRVFHVEHVSVPGLDAQRCLVWMERRPPG